MTISQHLTPAAVALRSASREADADADADADIADLVDAGDGAGAVRRLMQRHGAAVYRYCRATLRDAALADDVHQQVFVEAFRDLPRFSRRSKLRVWLFAIVRHRVLDAAKHRRRARTRIDDSAGIGVHVGDGVDVGDGRPSPADALDDARLRVALLACLDELPARTRTALLLHYQQGFTFAEMAQICRERPRTLYARVTRALPVLRTRIEARLGPLR